MSKSLKRKRSWSWLLWLMGVAALVAGGVAFKRSRPQQRLAVRTHTVARGRVRDLVSTVAAGRLAARREATIRAEVAGRVVRLAHRRGERVHTGDLLIAYDAQDLRDRVRAAESSVQLAQAQTAQAQLVSSAQAADMARAKILLLTHAVAERTEIADRARNQRILQLGFSP